MLNLQLDNMQKRLLAAQSRIRKLVASRQMWREKAYVTTAKERARMKARRGG